MSTVQKPKGSSRSKREKKISDDQKDQHQRDTGNDLCIQHGDVGNSHENGTPALFHVVHGQAGTQPDERGNEGRQKSNDHCIPKGQKNLFILEKLCIPLCGKAAPAGTALGLVKGKDHQSQDGRIQKHKNKNQIDVGANLFQCFSFRKTPPFLLCRICS